MLRNSKIFKSLIKHVVIASTRNYQVTVVGGASEIGQTLCLMLRAQPSISKLVIHDTREQTPGVVMDLSLIPTNATVTAFNGHETLDRALHDSNIVLAVGGEVQKPDLTLREQLTANKEFIRTLAAKVSKVQPMPFVGIITEPINSLVPFAAEILKINRNYDSKKLFGVTATDSMRAQTLYGVANGVNPRECAVPVIGGHSRTTIIPLLSQSKPSCDMTETTIHELTNKIRKWEDFVTQAKRGRPPTLAVAYGALMFTRSILDALNGRPNRIPAFVENNDFGTSYFSGLVTVDFNGVTEMERYTNLSQFECSLLENSIEQLRQDVSRGKTIWEIE